MLKYMTAQEAAEQWGISKRRVQVLCSENRISNVQRVGNMWLLPTSSKKPKDARLKTKCVNSKHLNPFNSSKNKLKSLVRLGLNTYLNYDVNAKDAKILILILFASELLYKYLYPKYNIVVLKKYMYDYFLEYIDDKKIINFKVDDLIFKIRTFVCKNNLNDEEILSWCYQYLNDGLAKSEYSNTQFFTDKYMIEILTKDLKISDKQKVLDFCCGGGNFLLYCVEKFISEQNINKKNSKKTIETKLNTIYSKLYGYEIDEILALTASFNMKLKYIIILLKNNIQVDLNKIKKINVNIFYPCCYTTGGALDYKICPQNAYKVLTKTKYNIIDVFKNTDIILTNPPFMSVKGMPPQLKKYLKNNYAISKCDMCNAFILLSQKVLTPGGIACLVTQNSWMYLDSYTELRKYLLQTGTINYIYELGSNAFQDLNGEKSNVVLLKYTNKHNDNNNCINLISLKNIERTKLSESFSLNIGFKKCSHIISQKDVLNNVDSRFDMISSSKLRSRIFNADKYGDYAIPMQGTSTGNAKELVGYFWEHLGDYDWVPVSKGGGYSRWQGLNYFCVKWGKNGEYIKKTKGSAIRNTSFFDSTQMVFSDTGTAGLNIRKLIPGQIFIASGPGIRVKSGNQFSHMAFLNSRLASYYIKLLSPKYTIAAGYIAKLPVYSKIINSSLLASYAKNCIKYKKQRLAMRAINPEFKYIEYTNDINLNNVGLKIFFKDLELEWQQIKAERKIDDFVEQSFHLLDEDKQVINDYIGEKLVYLNENNSNFEICKTADIGNLLFRILDSNCNLIRTKANKNSLGCDGFVEYLSQQTNLSCEYIYNYFKDKNNVPDDIKTKYTNLFIHNLVLSIINYRKQTKKITLKSVLSCIKNKKDKNILQKWIFDHFNNIHTLSFFNSPMYFYDKDNELFIINLEKK